MTRDQAFLPILMAALAVASLSLMDAFMKSAALAVGALTAAWLRSLLATGSRCALACRGGLAETRSAAAPSQRSTVATFMALTFFYALTKLPIAEAIAISFVAPLIALYLARIMLETIRSRQSSPRSSALRGRW